MSRYLFLVLAAGCALGPSVSATEAAISLDTTTGVGFVGKGAVQSAFGWNNAGLQENAGGITFSYQVSAVYQQSCLHTTGHQQMVVEKTFQKTVDLDAAVAFAARRNPQDKVTGFNLTGISGSSGDAPADLCNPGMSEPDSVWTPDPNGAYPQLTQTSSTPATLYATFDGVSHAIWTEGDGDEGDDGAGD